MQYILLAGCGKRHSAALTELFAAEGLTALTAADALEALDAVVQKNVRLIILSASLTGGESLHALLNIRAEKGIPLLLLTCPRPNKLLQSASADFKLSVSATADLILKTAAMLVQSGVPASASVHIGALCLNTAAKTVSVNGAPVTLTPTEFRILELLCKNRGTVFSPAELYRLVWNDPCPAKIENAVAVHIRHLREKIEPDPKNPRYIKAVWGLGYMMR